MNSNLYIEKESFMHFIDPRIKILLFIFSAITVFYFDIKQVSIYFFIIVLLVISSGAMINIYRLRIIIVSIFIFSIVIWTFFTNISGLNLNILKNFSLEGLIYGVLSALRLIGLMFIGILIVSTTKVEDISTGLIKFGIPYKFAFAFTTTFRLVPLFVSGIFEIKNAQKMRGVDPDIGNTLVRIKNFVPILIPALSKTIKKTNDMAMALEVKCFGIYNKRSNTEDIKLTFKDLIFTSSYFITLLTLLLVGGN